MVAAKTKLPSVQKSVVEQVIQLLTTLPDRTNSSEEILHSGASLTETQAYSQK